MNPCEQNHLLLNKNKTWELAVDFHLTAQTHTAMNIQGSDIEKVDSFRHLSVHMNTQLYWFSHTTVSTRRSRAAFTC